MAITKVRLLTLLLLLSSGTLTVAAQNYTYHLTHGQGGSGSVHVYESPAIDAVVNGKINIPTEHKTVSPSSATAPSSAETATIDSSTTEELTAVDNSKKVVKGGQKITGYRVQVYAGSNSREDKSKAEAAGNQMKRLFPDQPIYVHFYSPRWICRMGNYRTYEEAEEMLQRVKDAGYKAATLVKGTITPTD